MLPVPYRQRLNELGFSEAALVKGAICLFTNYYQFFCEAMFAFIKQLKESGFLRSTDGKADGWLLPFLYEEIPQNLRHRVGRLTIQMVVDAIQESDGHEDWIEEFKNKYGLLKPILPLSKPSETYR